MSPRWKLVGGLSGALIFGIAVAVGAFFLFGNDKEEAAQAADGRYNNSRVRFAFEYPPQWNDLSKQIKSRAPEGADLVDFVAVGHAETDTGIVNGVQVIVVRINHKVAAAALEQELLDLEPLFKQQASRAGGKLKEPQWVELGGLRARQYITEYSLQSNNAPAVEVASAQVITFFGDRQYTVNCQGRLATFDTDVLPGCEQILQTFRFK